MNAEEARRISPHVRGRQARVARDGLKFLDTIFARNLGVNRLAFAEGETLCCDRDGLRSQAE